ncbi:MAG: hypothetical protein H8E17_02430 [Deltaproteobacteria bacterium]|nr:hypothetical protein [Deltaproteobacteria bacterium]
MLELAPGIIIIIIFFIAVGFMLAKSKKDKDEQNVVDGIIDKAIKSNVVHAPVKKTKSSSFKDMAVGSIEHTIYTCYLEGKSTAEIFHDPRLAEWKSKGKIYDKIIYIEYVGIQMIKDGLIDSTKEDRKIDKTFKPIGNIDPVCPCCNFRFDKKPGKTKKCPNCGAFIYVLPRPYDRERVLVSESQAKQIKEQWNQHHNR